MQNISYKKFGSSRILVTMYRSALLRIVIPKLAIFLVTALFLASMISRMHNYGGNTALEEDAMKTYTPKDIYLAVIVAVRDRESHIVAFTHYINQFLAKQQLTYKLFFIEQIDSLPFNRAALLNVGVLEADKVSNFSCFIFHDVDHIPLSDSNIYSCNSAGPVHFASASEKFDYEMPYPKFFGAVVGFSREQFYHIGGFGNCYWGWGGEDDDMRARAEKHGLVIVRKPALIGRYSSLPHNQSTPNAKRIDLINWWEGRSEIDGVMQTRYTILNEKKTKRYTRITVSLADMANISYCP